MLASAGTADATTQATICSELFLKPSTTKLFISPNRLNLRITVKVKKNEMENQLDWLIDAAKEKGSKMPNTVIFCITVKDMVSVVNLLLKYALIPVGSTSGENLTIAIFHSVSWPKKKENRLITK